MDIYDFRNNSLFIIENIFILNGFTNLKINNFKKSFRTFEFDNLSFLKGVKGLDKITADLPFRTLEIEKSVKDENGNEKFVFKTFDGFRIESVFMPNKDSISVCVSTQIGCRMGCTFCRTGFLGFKRNLMPDEILEQVRLIYRDRVRPAKLDCVTFMGMGEPFDNLENCKIAFEWIISSWGYQVGRQKITFSTIGTHKFPDFLKWENLPNLAVSLHSAIPEKRKALIPSAVLQLDILKNYLTDYTGRTKKQVTIEYCLFKGINDKNEDIDALADYLKGIKCKINLLNYNKNDRSLYQELTSDEISIFKDKLKEKGIPVLYRKSLGTGIGAGCGQLGG
jgi:23S rRNA (adenine2503-C2)-methyltransferase